MATYYKWDRSNPEMELYDKKRDGNAFQWSTNNPDRAYYIYGSEVILKAGVNGRYGQLQIPEGSSGSLTYGYGTNQRIVRANNYIMVSADEYLTSSSLLSEVYISQTDATILAQGDSEEGRVNLRVGSGSGNIIKVYGCRYTGPGETIDSVYSLESTTYPQNTYQDGYYYVRSTVTSPTVPTSFQCPTTIIVPQVTISWNAATSNVPDYPIKLYEISCATNNGSTYDVLGTTESTTYTYNLPENITSIRFRVRAQDTNDQWGNYTYGSWCTYISIPTITVPERVFTAQPISIEWNGEGADSYQLQRKTNLDSDWQDLYNGTDLSYTDTGGTWLNVQYRVRAIVGDAQGEWGTSSVILCYDSEKIIQMNYKNSNNTYSLLYPYSKEAVVMGWKKLAEVPIVSNTNYFDIEPPFMFQGKGERLVSGLVYILNVKDLRYVSSAPDLRIQASGGSSVFLYMRLLKNTSSKISYSTISRIFSFEGFGDASTSGNSMGVLAEYNNNIASGGSISLNGLRIGITTANWWTFFEDGFDISVEVYYF